MIAVMVPVHLLLVVFVGFSLAGDSDPLRHWRLAIFSSHIAMAVVLPLFWVMFYRLARCHKNSAGKVTFFLQVLVGFIYLLFGAILCVFDQLVASNITPFILACVGVALVLIVHPVLTLVNYTAVFIFFFFGVAFTQTNKEMLLSIRLNGISAAGIGVGLALILWRSNMMALRQGRMIEMQRKELEDKNRQLEILATHDPLTKLYNRMQFMKTIENEINRSRRTGKEACVILLDIDHFKLVNDSYGHPAGDAVLEKVAEIISGLLRETDVPARFGGEEFTILLPETSLAGGVVVAEKIINGIGEYTFTCNEEKFKISASIGVALLDTDGDKPFDTTYQKVDRALYEAKRKGRNRVEAG